MKTQHQKRVAITRSHQGNLELAPKLEAMGLEPVPIDLLAFLPLESWVEVDSRLNHLSDFDWVLFTSSTGVRFFVERMRTLRLSLGWGGVPKIGAVGEGTSAALNAAEMRVSFQPESYLTRSLAEELPESGKSILLLRSDIAEKEMGRILEKRGFIVDEAAIYRTSELELDDVGPVLQSEIVIFGSPSAVDALCRPLSPDLLSKVTKKKAACIGPVTAAAAKRYGFKEILEAPTHTFDSLLEVVRRTEGLA